MTIRSQWNHGIKSGVSQRGTPTLVQSVYMAMREDILSGKLGPGTKLRADKLKQEYDVGASTLREALNLLVGEALVDSEGQKGFRVSPMSEADFRDIVAVRKMLETQAMRESMAHGDDEWEGQVVSAFHRLSRIEERVPENPTGLSGQWEEGNRAFHAALIAACPSNWLHYFIGVLFHQSERYRRVALAHSDGFKKRDVHAEHEAIYKAVLDRDAEAACLYTEQHIERTLNFLAIEGFFEQLQAWSNDGANNPSASRVARLNPRA